MNDGPISADEIPFSGHAAADERRARLLDGAIETERARRQARRFVDEEERPKAKPPEFLSLRDRLLRPRPATRWRIDAWQPTDSRVTAVAQFKAGKTTLMANHIRSLVDGDPFLGQYAADVLEGMYAHIDTEMSEGKLLDWLHAQGIRHTNRVLLIPLRGNVASFDLMDSATRGEWAARLRAHSVQHLTLDCLRPVLDALGLDEQTEAGRFLVAFDALLAEAQISEALIVQHMGHTGERARGDSRLRDWPDAEWRLVRQDDNPSSARYITAYGRDVDIPESQLLYDPHTRHLAIAGGNRKEAAAEAALDAVLAALEGQELSGRQIEQACRESASSYGRDAIRDAIALGIRSGQIEAHDGPRNSILHRRSARVRGSARALNGRTEFECAAPPIGARTRTHTQEFPSERAERFDPSKAFLPSAGGKS